MKNIIAAAIAAIALTSCDEDEMTRINSGNKHVEAASADYTAATKSAAARTLGIVSDYADETSKSLSK